MAEAEAASHLQAQFASCTAAEISAALRKAKGHAGQARRLLRRASAGKPGRVAAEGEAAGSTAEPAPANTPGPAPTAPTRSAVAARSPAVDDDPPPGNPPAGWELVMSETKGKQYYLNIATVSRHCKAPGRTKSGGARHHRAGPERACHFAD